MWHPSMETEDKQKRTGKCVSRAWFELDRDELEEMRYHLSLDCAVVSHAEEEDVFQGIMFFKKQLRIDKLPGWYRPVSMSTLEAITLVKEARPTYFTIGRLSNRKKSRPRPLWMKAVEEIPDFTKK